jgi:predicted dehydrogenase
MRVGVVGCGDVSHEYFESALAHPEIVFVACTDLDATRAAGQADRYGLEAVRDLEELLREPSIELIVNLTPPATHTEVTLAAIESGKHVYSEKPLATSLDAARLIADAANAARVSVGCAPATFLGGPLQTCRKVVDEGWIGHPIAAAAFVTSRGYEHWHPNVRFHYSQGGGPMFDVGPYWITSMLSLLGSAAHVTAYTTAFDQVRLDPLSTPAELIPVDVATHATGIIGFESGAVGTLLTSWDIWATRLPYLEIYGTEGTLSLSNPDSFKGLPRLRRAEPGDLAKEPTAPCGGTWYELPLTHSDGAGRAVGVADMAVALRSGRCVRANYAFAYHTLEIMLAFDASSSEGRRVEIASSCDRPAPLPRYLSGAPISLQ